MQTVNDWLIWLETAHPRVIDLGLERVFAVAQHLQLIPLPMPVITVAGTNGKGSTVAFLESILQAAGYRVGAYTSPHLLRFNERIRITGQDITDAQLIASFMRIKAGLQDQTLTYFEFTTLAAFDAFKHANLDIVVLEVGLGGRLDAVNIQDPCVSVITTISLDHTDWLGSTREAIALEKAGIYRTHVPAVCGDRAPPATLLSYVQEHHIPCDFVGVAYDYTQTFNNTWTWQSPAIEFSNLPVPQLPLQNAATALMALQRLPASLSVNRQAIVQGLAGATMPGRFQQLKSLPQVVVDVAHNPESGAYLARQLIGQGISTAHAVVGMLNTKDIKSTVEPLLCSVDVWHVAANQSAQSVTADELYSVLVQAGAKQVEKYATITDALTGALQARTSGDWVVVFGSFYTVAEILWTHN